MGGILKLYVLPEECGAAPAKDGEESIRSDSQWRHHGYTVQNGEELANLLIIG